MYGVRRFLVRLLSFKIIIFNAIDLLFFQAVGVMKPGHVFTIEPMISEGVWGDTTWPDNWTSVTQVQNT